MHKIKSLEPIAKLMFCMNSESKIQNEIRIKIRIYSDSFCNYLIVLHFVLTYAVYSPDSSYVLLAVSLYLF